MLFSSAIFLFLFLPLTVLTYYLVKGRLKNIILLIASLVFYAWGGVSYSVILIFSILFNYLFGYLIHKNKNKKLYLSIGVGLNLLVLGIFKYADFIIENINKITESFSFEKINQPHIILPIGISFFTFQAISYLVDIYRNDVKYRKNFVNLALYISLFPQLIAGPIVRYHDIANQLIKRNHSLINIGKGVERFIIGLAKKVLLANNFAVVADSIFNSDYSTLSTPTAWLGIISYSFQIYFDFSGYSDMAIGLGKIFGFTFLENFNFPYISKTIKEFWRRWHISLSTWFRDYLYIPLGGNRVSQKRVYLNLLIVFTLTGFWHGASWNFLFWGLFHGLFLVLERIGLDKLLKKLWTPFQHLYALTIVIIGWVFFRVESINDGFYFVKQMFSSPVSDNLWLSYFDIKFIIVLTVAILGSMNFFPKLKTAFYSITKNNFVKTAGEFAYSIILLMLFAASSVMLLSDTYNPFIYFRF